MTNHASTSGSKQKKGTPRRPMGVANDVQVSTFDTVPMEYEGEPTPQASPIPKSVAERVQREVVLSETIPNWYTDPKEDRDFLAIFALEEIEHGRLHLFFQWMCRRTAQRVGPDKAFGLLGQIGTTLIKAHKVIASVVKARLKWASAQLRVEMQIETGGSVTDAEREAHSAAMEANKITDEASLTASHLGDQSSIGALYRKNPSLPKE